MLLTPRMPKQQRRSALSPDDADGVSVQRLRSSNEILWYRHTSLPPGWVQLRIEIYNTKYFIIYKKIQQDNVIR